jgi:hypothetical protein
MPGALEALPDAQRNGLLTGVFGGWSGRIL